MGISPDQSPELGAFDGLTLLSHTQLSVSIKLHFRDSKGQLIKTVEANEGDDILSIAHEHDVDLEGTSLSF
jgi:hypothetical protein